MAELLPLLKSTALRKLEKVPPTELVSTNFNLYPANAPSLVLSLHNTGYYQSMMSNTNNYAAISRLDVTEVVDGKMFERRLVDEKQCQAYLDGVRNPTPGSSVSVRAIFCYIEKVGETSFGCRLSLSRARLLQMVEQFDCSPQFVSSMFGEPDYWAPGEFTLHDQSGSKKSLDFFCQQPRWQIHTQDLPLSVYMTHDVAGRATSYIVVANEGHSRLLHVKQRIATCLSAVGPADVQDPFMLHCLIVHETFLDARSVVTPLRWELYDQLDRVDEYTQKPARKRGKEDLEKLTIALHDISQTIDSMTGSVEMTGMILRRMQTSHDRFCDSNAQVTGVSNANIKISDSLRYLLESADSQKRWLMSYKSRKDTAMNLVFNLVTQQDARTSTAIAEEAKADGAAMKTIAAMTMVFLPGTFLASVFSMRMLDGAKWQLFVAIVVPLTVSVVGCWWLWISGPRILGWLTRKQHEVKGVDKMV